MQKEPYEELNRFVQSKAKGFTSLKYAKEKIRNRKSKTPTTQEKEILQLNVEDPNFASLLNKNGVVQIGEQIFKITNQHTYIFKDRDAYQSFDFKKTKASNPTLSYVQPCHKQHQKLTKLRNDIYRADNCGSGGGGGGYNPGDDNTDLDVDKLDPNDNLNIDYPHKKTKEYRSGGTKGRLKGHSWNQYFWIYSSVGAKSEHQRHTWGRWWDRTADKITLESFIKYSYGEKRLVF